MLGSEAAERLDCCLEPSSSYFPWDSLGGDSEGWGVLCWEALPAAYSGQGRLGEAALIPSVTYILPRARAWGTLYLAPFPSLPLPYVARFVVDCMPGAEREGGMTGFLALAGRDGWGSGKEWVPTFLSPSFGEQHIFPPCAAGGLDTLSHERGGGPVLCASPFPWCLGQRLLPLPSFSCETTYPGYMCDSIGALRHRIGHAAQKLPG